MAGLTIRMERVKVYNLQVNRFQLYAIGSAGVLVHNSGGIRNVDPNVLRNPSSRPEVDPFKLAEYFKQHGRRPHNMEPIEVRIRPDGELEIMNGVTRAEWARICGENVPIVIQP